MNPSEFLQIVSPNKDDPTVFKMGNISSAYSSGWPKVKFDGESADSVRLYPYMSSYTPAANDRVLVAIVGHSGVILGKII